MYRVCLAPPMFIFQILAYQIPVYPAWKGTQDIGINQTGAFGELLPIVIYCPELEGLRAKNSSNYPCMPKIPYPGWCRRHRIYGGDGASWVASHDQEERSTCPKSRLVLENILSFHRDPLHNLNDRVAQTVEGSYHDTQRQRPFGGQRFCLQKQTQVTPVNYYLCPVIHAG